MISAGKQQGKMPCRVLPTKIVRTLASAEKWYVDHQKDGSKLTCIVHGPVNSPYECKVLGEFDYKYSRIGPTKDHRKEFATKKKFIIQQNNNAIFNHAVNEIILKEDKILSVKYEAHETIDSEVDKDNIYEIDKMSLDDK